MSVVVFYTQGKKAYYRSMKKTQRLTKASFRLWLLSVVIGGGLLLFSYVAVQQSLRLGLNEPQLQMAQDIAAQLNSDKSTPQSLVPTTIIDESQSLSPFVTIINKNGDVLATSGKIGDVVPLPPLSAFEDSQKRSNHWFTWQHDDGKVRDAAVVVPFNGKQSGYVLVARSTAQVEDTIGHITVLAGWTLLGILVAPALVLFLL